MLSRQRALHQAPCHGMVIELAHAFARRIHELRVQRRAAHDAILCTSSRSPAAEPLPVPSGASWP